MVRQGLRTAHLQRQTLGAKVVRASLGLAFATLSLMTAACGKTDQKPQTEQKAEVQALTPAENAAAVARGARAISSSFAAERFADKNLNDGTPEAWGSAEDQNDTWAAIVLPNPQAMHEFRISLFSPSQPPRSHLRDIRVVAADSEEADGAKWLVLRARLSTEQLFSEKITVPPGDDGKVVGVEIDSSDPNYGPHKIWGIACFTASKGDARNYLPPGTGIGIYVRELQMK